MVLLGHRIQSQSPLTDTVDFMAIHSPVTLTVNKVKLMKWSSCINHAPLLPEFGFFIHIDTEGLKGDGYLYHC